VVLEGFTHHLPSLKYLAALFCDCRKSRSI